MESDDSHTTTGSAGKPSPVAVAEAMLDRDRASWLLGITLIDASDGYAEVEMDVAETMLNGHNSCHGGLIFALADTAFAIACNSDNQITVGSACHIDYMRPAVHGDRLRARAVQREAAGRTGLYDVRVYNRDDETVAWFHGRSQRVRGTVLADGSDDAAP